MPKHKEPEALSTRKPLTPSSSPLNLSILSSMGIAIVIHALIALAVGSYVVFEGIVPVPFFESDFIDNSGQSAMIEETPTLIEDEPLPDVEVSSVQSVVEESGDSDAPDMSDLITVSSALTTPSITMPTTVGNPNLLPGQLFQKSKGGSGNGQGTGSGKALKSIFGSSSVREGLVGSIYDLRRKADGKEIQAKANPNFVEVVEKLLTAKGQINPAKIEEYYRAPYALGTSLFMIPGGKSTEGPQAFGMETLPGHQMWLAHYKGFVKAPQPGKYRFIGSADEIMIVSVEGKVVLDATWRKSMPWTKGNPTGLKPKEYDENDRIGPGDGIYTGEWFQVGTGPFEMEIVIGEGWGGMFGCLLAIEEESVNYTGQPRPVFKTSGYEDLLQPQHQQFIKAKGKVTLDGPTFLTRF